MPKILKANKIIKVLEQNGFTEHSQKGSHKKFRKVESGIVLTVIVPVHGRDIPYGTFRSIQRQSGLSEDLF
jgi:predicted RNA binding protein YcfA (HicA-like mRNA interferase family)